MTFIRGFSRLLFIVIVLLSGTIAVLLTAWFPWRIRGARPAAWMATWMARIFTTVFRIRVHCPEAAKLRRFEGFVFPNHTSYVDIILAVYIVPMRFVAKAEIRNYPLIGTLARAIGCVFVDRQDKASRSQTRQTLGQAELYPPIVLYPEGKTGGGDQLHPFRHGAFEIAAQHGIPFLPCLIVYDRPEIVRWLGDTFTRAIWRLASRPGEVNAHLIFLDIVHPAPADDGAALAKITHESMAAALAAAEAEHISGSTGTI
jgi:1-acyl-sn-glycerol-3-phosphate acyltransferase